MSRSMLHAGCDILPSLRASMVCACMSLCPTNTFVDGKPMKHVTDSQGERWSDLSCSLIVLFGLFLLGYLCPSIASPFAFWHKAKLI